MADTPTTEATIAFPLTGLPYPCHTYYKIIGTLSKSSPPLIILHGGPGAGHEYLLPFAALWQLYSIPIIFYDQIGCASSTHLRDKAGDQAFWREELFIAELDNLIDTLNLREHPGFHILGHSWGGRLAAAYAASQPSGLRRLVIASGIASTELADRGRQMQLAQLPEDTRQAFHEASRTGNFQGETYQAARGVFDRIYMYRGEGLPEEMKAAMSNLRKDSTVYQTMLGPNPMEITGSLRDWTCIPRLPNITATTLVYNGEMDTSHDIATEPFFEHIPHVKWITFCGGGHMCHLEDGLRDRIFRVVGKFLLQGTDVSMGPEY